MIRNRDGWCAATAIHLVCMLVVTCDVACDVSRARAQELHDWRLAEVSTAVFADQDQSWRIRRGAAPPRDALLVWSVTSNERTLARGESRWESMDSGEFATSFIWRSPPVKDDAIVAARCTLAVTVAQRTIAETAFDAWIFPRDPFALRRQWLKDLDLVVLTSDESTQQMLAKNHIPCRTITSVTAIQRLQDELLIVADIGPADRNRLLATAVESYARRGGRCLWLTPPAGATVLASDVATAAASDGRWDRLDLRRHGVILELDKRLDANTWRTGSADYGTFRMAARKQPGGDVTAAWEAAADHDGWTWIDAATAEGGRLIVCGFPLLKQWEQGPTPRYVLLYVLQSLATNSTKNKPNPKR